jgi:hypothetical protein
MALVDSAVSVVSIVRPVTGEPSDRTRHLIEQWPDLLATIDIIRRQLRRNHLAGVSVDAKMQIAPRASRIMLLHKPLAGTTQFQASAVHQ